MNIDLLKAANHWQEDPMNHPTAQPTMQTLVDFCLANHPDIQEVSGLTEEEIRRASTLLLASPALLAALKRIIELADDPENEKDSDLVDIIDWDHIRRTIAQAEGGTQP